MDMQLKEDFIRRWRTYFPGAGLPLAFYYTDTPVQAEIVKPGSVSRCFIGALAKAREGQSMAFGADSIGCPGGKKYLGFAEQIGDDIDRFLSCGIPGKMEGERYKKSPGLVKEFFRKVPGFKAPARYIVFKRWDLLNEKDVPEVVVFLAKPDVLAGLFALANYDTADPHAAVVPWGSGCSTVVMYPYLEKDSAVPRAVIGMFDISARPFVARDEISFAVPLQKLAGMVAEMEESFLVTSSWKALQKRL